MKKTASARTAHPQIRCGCRIVPDRILLQDKAADRGLPCGICICHSVIYTAVALDHRNAAFFSCVVFLSLAVPEDAAAQKLFSTFIAAAT